MRLSCALSCLNIWPNAASIKLIKNKFLKISSGLKYKKVLWQTVPWILFLGEIIFLMSIVFLLRVSWCFFATTNWKVALQKASGVFVESVLPRQKLTSSAETTYQMQTFIPFSWILSIYRDYWRQISWNVHCTVLLSLLMQFKVIKETAFLKCLERTFRCFQARGLRQIYFHRICLRKSQIKNIFSMPWSALGWWFV